MPLLPRRCFPETRFNAGENMLSESNQTKPNPEIVPPVRTASSKIPFQIFAVCEQDGFSFTREFLQTAVKNFNKYQRRDLPKIGFPDPPVFSVSDAEIKAAGIAIGHEDVRIGQLAKSGDELATLLAKALFQATNRPACGWISSLFMVGDAVFASFEGVPEDIAAAMNGGLLPYCSAEWYADYVGPSGAHYGPMLRRVAILGGELPKLKFLGKLPPMVFSELGGAFPAGKIMCFSEGRNMSHDELIAALAAFIPNVGTIGDKIDDAGLSALLELYKSGAKETEATGGMIETSSEDAMKKIAACGETMDPNAVKAFAEVMSIKGQLAAELAKAQAMNKQSAAALTILATEAKNKERADIHAFCESLVAKGILQPHEMSDKDGNGKPKPTIVDVLMTMDSQNKVLAFGETMLSPREFQMKKLAEAPPVKAFSERMQATPTARPGQKDMSERERALAASPIGKLVLMDEAKKRGDKTTVDGRPVI